jgi:hypothetical protein
MAVGQELVFPAAGVDEEHVGIARLSQGQGLARADGDDVDASVEFLFKSGQDFVEQAGISRTGGGR